MKNLRELSTGEYLTVEIDGRWYLMTVMNLSTYSVGVLLDVDRMLAPLRNVQEAPEEYFQLIDNTGNVIGDTTEILSIIEQESYLDIGYASETIDYQLVRLISPNERKERMPSADRIIQIFAFLSLMIIPLLWWIIHHMMLKPLKVLDEGMRRIEQEDLEYRIDEQSKTREFQHLFRAFNTMSERIRTLTIEAYEKEVEKLEIETTNLRLQMNPHMLLNSLNMIYSFAQSKNHEYIKTFTLHLVHYFRYVLRKNTTFVTIEQEMDFVNNYMEIQKIRFPGAFTYVYDIEENLYDVLIPPLIIQNFVENSIKYGLKIGSEIEILITVRAQDKFLHISICDTGNGMCKERLELLRAGQMIEDDTGQHIGIWNCRRRLNVIYGKESTLTISSIPDEGTQVWIELPINRDDKIGENNDVINRR